MAFNLYDYTDYRRLLREWFEDRAGRPSLRGMAKKIGCSPALLSSVTSGTRDLAAPLVEKLADAMSLDADAKTYFLLLVEWEQAATVKARRQALDRIMAMRRFRTARRIVDAMYLVFSRWYYPAIVELARCTGFRDDPAWVAATLVPAVTVEEAAEALEVLAEAGFLVREPDGTVRVAEVTWTTEHEVGRIAGPAVGSLHRWMLARAPQAIEDFPHTERHFGSMSIALAMSDYPELKQAVMRFEEDLLTRFAARESPDRVFQLSLQLFPLTRSTRS